MVHEIELALPAEEVFGFFTDAERLVRWIGLSASLSPVPGGGFRFEIQPGQFCEGAYVEVVPPETPGAQLARLLFVVRGRHDGLTWLELRPHTGRKHQLRVQLASRGCPIYGDAKYGSDHAFGPAIALHARALTFLHPTTREPVTLKADIPAVWCGRFAHLLANGPA